MQAEQPVDDRMGRVAFAQGRLDGPVTITLAFLGMDDHAAHQVYHGYDLQGKLLV